MTFTELIVVFTLFIILITVSFIFYISISTLANKPTIVVGTKMVEKINNSESIFILIDKLIEMEILSYMQFNVFLTNKKSVRYEILHTDETIENISRNVKNKINFDIFDEDEMLTTKVALMEYIVSKTTEICLAYVSKYTR